jgi:hypothetical protein
LASSFHQDNPKHPAPALFDDRHAANPVIPDQYLEPVRLLLIRLAVLVPATHFTNAQKESKNYHLILVAPPPTQGSGQEIAG